MSGHPQVLQGVESIVAGHMIRWVRLTNGGTCFADVQAKNGGPDPGINR